MNDDLISRQTAIMHFVKASKNYECGMLDLKEITHELWQILSAQPERKKGTWVNMGDFEQCSVCRGTHLKEFQSYYGKTIWVKSNFCPYCGADMRGEQG